MAACPRATAMQRVLTIVSRRDSDGVGEDSRRMSARVAQAGAPSVLTWCDDPGGLDFVKWIRPKLGRTRGSPQSSVDRSGTALVRSFNTQSGLGHSMYFEWGCGFAENVLVRSEVSYPGMSKGFAQVGTDHLQGLSLNTVSFCSLRGSSWSRD